MTNLDYLYNPAAAQELFGDDCFVDKVLHFQIIERGTVLPHKHMYINGQWTWGFGGIVDQRGAFVKSSFVHGRAGEAYTPTEEIQHIPAIAVYLGLFYPVWGHSITDNIRRFWFLKSEVFQKYFKDCPLIYIPWGGMFELEQQKNFSRMLEIFEIDVNRLLPIYHPAQFEKIILPDESFFRADDKINFTPEYREAIEYFRDFAIKNQTPTSSKKIYYFYGMAQTGEERLAEYLNSKGYEPVSPETLTFDEQLNVLINAESFASTLGSCAHNSIFLRDGTDVILIPRAANRFTTYQQTLDQLHPLNINYVDSTLSIFEKMNGPYCFIISRQLKNFFGDEFNGYEDDDFKIFLTYVKNSMNGGYQFNEESLQYYAPIYEEFIEQLRQREDLLKAFDVTLV